MTAFVAQILTANLNYRSMDYAKFWTNRPIAKKRLQSKASQRVVLRLLRLPGSSTSFCAVQTLS